MLDDDFFSDIDGCFGLKVQKKKKNEKEMNTVGDLMDCPNPVNPFC